MVGGGGDRTHHFRALWLRAPAGHYINVAKLGAYKPYKPSALSTRTRSN